MAAKMILQGNALHIALADESVQCCITSPPYWGLRDYGTATWEGGDPECEHKKAGANKVFGNPAFNENRPSRALTDTVGYRDVCAKCGARRIDAQLGLERVHDCLGWATGAPCGECYVCHTRQWAKEVWRVLRADGTFWLNLGDSYASGKGTCYNPGGGENSLGQERKAAGAHPLDRGNTSTLTAMGLKPKDLCGIPWRVAFALQADGWWLRSDIVWAKRNCMPESVTDRPTRSHEYVFMLAKSSRYYWDAEAVREPLAASTLADGRNGTGRHTQGKIVSKYFDEESPDKAAPDAPSWYRAKTFVNPEQGRNLRDVWHLATEPYSGAHFAVMPTKIVETCIKAGTSEKGCCPTCGAPWERVTEREFRPQEDVAQDKAIRGAYAQKPMDASNGWQGFPRGTTSATTLGWRPTCLHGTEHPIPQEELDADPSLMDDFEIEPYPPVPCVVLDMFSGASTVPMVAERLGRRGIGADLSLPYCQMAKGRIYQDAPLWGLR